MDHLKKKTLILMGIFLSLFLAALDQTIITTSLPHIMLNFQQPEYYSWVMVSYLLSSVIFLPIFGRLCDIISVKKLIIIANSIFVLGSYLCSLSNSIYELILFRFIQGIGGGGIFSITFTTIGIMYAPRERGKIQGWISSIFGLSSILGPIIGGYISYLFSWKWIFLINVPLGIFIIILLVIYMPLVSPVSNQKFDLLGSILLFIWSFTLIMFFSEIRIFKYDKITYFILSLVGISLYYKHEKLASSPLFDINLLKNDTFIKSSIATFFLGGTFMGLLTFLPMYLTTIYHLNEMETGYVITFLTIGIVLSSTFAGKLATKFGEYKLILIISNLLISINLFILFIVTKAMIPNLILFVLMLIPLGIGLGPILPLYIIAVQNEIKFQRIGTATSSIQFFRQMGATIGVAILGYVYTFYWKFIDYTFQEIFSILILVCLLFTLISIIATFSLENIPLKDNYKLE